MQEVRNENESVVKVYEPGEEILPIEKPKYFTLKQKVYGLDRHGVLMKDAGGKNPKIFTIKDVDYLVHIYQGSVPFSPNGYAIAKIGSYWFGCKLISIDDYNKQHTQSVLE